MRIAPASIVSLLALALPTAALAQTRVQEETLVYSDPTVAAPQHWLLSLNAELWGLATPHFNGTSTVNGTTRSGSEQVTGIEGGGSVAVGYDAFLLQLTGLGGSGTVTKSFAGGLDQQGHESVAEVEVIGRYILTSVQLGGVTPYVIAGYDYTSLDATTIDSAGFPFSSTGTLQLHSANTYHTFFAGGGGLYEFNPVVGLRFDLALGPSFGETRNENALPGVPSDFTDTGLAGIAHLTAYWKITDEVTAQLGLKGAAILTGASSGVNSWGGIGGFGSIGYLRRF